MKRYLICLAAGFVMAGMLSAQTSAVLPFLRIERDPVYSGMAGAGRASSASVAYATFRNPAAVPFAAVKGDVAASWQNWAPNGVKSMNLNAGGSFRVTDRIGLTFGGAYQAGTPYESLTGSGAVGETFTPSEMVVGLGAGFVLTESLSLGVSGRYASQSLAGSSKLSGVSMDAFLLYRRDRLSATAGIASIGPAVKSGSSSYALPASAALGVTYDLGFGEKNALLLAADADYFFSGGIGAALGMQYAYDDMVFVRAGYHLGTDKAPLPSFASVGFGVKFSGFHLDLGYLLASPSIGGTLSLGLGYAF